MAIKKVAPQLPKGFKAISGGGNSWKPAKKGESIEGVLTGVKVVIVERKEGKKTVKKEQNLYTIKTKDGDIDVWQSAGLKALESIKKGKPVYIQYTGSEVFKKGQQPMKQYLVATK